MITLRLTLEKQNALGDWSYPVQDRHQWREIFNMVKSFRAPNKVRKFLSTENVVASQKLNFMKL
jgi:hypothetical protein